MVFNDAPFLLGFLRENDESEKLELKASCGIEHDMIVVSKDIFVEDEYSIEKTPLEETCEECVEITPSCMELVDVTSLSSLQRTSNLLLS